MDGLQAIALVLNEPEEAKPVVAHDINENCASCPSNKACILILLKFYSLFYYKVLKTLFDTSQVI